MTELPKQYDHAAAQDRWYKFWEEQGYFHSEPDPAKKPFTIVIPPPNVTGALHLGHALNNSLQDILIRQKRMQGYNALWMPGTDHAGIATQAVVERRLLENEKKTRHDLGRAALVERIWAWKNEYETRILGQLKQMGASCDWARTRFTLDTICARAVRHTFFRLFKDGLIFRGKRLVNWDCFLQTAVSDDEVENKTVKGFFWHFQYPVQNPQPGEPTRVTIATTRPETMLGDTAVAVHPDPAGALDKAQAELERKLAEAPEKEKATVQTQLDDLAERKKTLLPELIKLRDMAKAGRKLMLPLVNREIPLVADEWAKPELGSGCVKITPAHDPNDYEVGKRQNLPMPSILNKDGTLNAEAGPYAGLTMPAGRERVVADLDKLGLLVKVEDREIELPHSDRSKTPIEPLLTDQWFVKMSDHADGRTGLAQMAMDAVSSGKVNITPARYGKSYLDWLGEKRDWPVSRQLWWGHRIPVWTLKLNDEFFKTWGERGMLGKGVTPAGIAAAEIRKIFEDPAAQDRDFALDPNSDAGTLRYCTLHEEADSIFEKLTEETQRRHDGKDLYSKYELAATYIDSIEREEDVLDTWFSSALWPHSTLGWPEKTPELAYYYPTSVLVTSRDIITLWVARMVLTGLYNVGDIPFRQVFIHPKILDGYGETMSKSKGNGVDPLDVVQKFGADALRFALAYLCTETQDVKLPVDFECPACKAVFPQTKENRELPRIKCPKCSQTFKTQWAKKEADLALDQGAVISERFELARNFCNKLWNAARFTLMNLEGYTPGPVADSELAVEDRWLLSRLETVTAEVTAALEGFRFSEACHTLYDFAWNEFCSFYVEMVKSRFNDPASRPVTQRLLAHSLDTLLRLLHPIIPFLTEEVWQLLGEVAPQRGLDTPAKSTASIMIAPWPTTDDRRRDTQIEARFACFQGVLQGLREIRSRQSIPTKESCDFVVRCPAASAELLKPMEPYFESMAHCRATAWGPDVTAPATSASFTFSSSGASYEVFVNLAAFLDVPAEIAKKVKERDKMAGMLTGKEAKLSNASFIERAPPEVVAKERATLEDMREQLRALDAVIAALKKG